MWRSTRDVESHLHARIASYGEHGLLHPQFIHPTRDLIAATLEIILGKGNRELFYDLLYNSSLYIWVDVVVNSVCLVTWATLILAVPTPVDDRATPLTNTVGWSTLAHLLVEANFPPTWWSLVLSTSCSDVRRRSNPIPHHI